MGAERSTEKTQVLPVAPQSKLRRSRWAAGATQCRSHRHVSAWGDTSGESPCARSGALNSAWAFTPLMPKEDVPAMTELSWPCCRSQPQTQDKSHGGSDPTDSVFRQQHVKLLLFEMLYKKDVHPYLCICMLEKRTGAFHVSSCLSETWSE